MYHKGVCHCVSKCPPSQVIIYWTALILFFEKTENTNVSKSQREARATETDDDRQARQQTQALAGMQAEENESVHASGSI